MKAVKIIILFIILLTVQVLLLNHLHLWGATPILYIWIIMKLPNDLPRGVVITVGFLIGLIVDLFCNTPGMHSLATVTLAFFRTPIIMLFVPHEDLKTTTVSLNSFGMASFVKYVVITTVLFCTTLYIVEAFSFFNPLNLLFKIIASSVLSILIIFGFENILPGRI